MSKEWKIAVVGATGLVGESLLKVLAERRFPVAAIHALASDRSLGRTVEFGDDELRVGDVATFDFATVDFALFAASEQAAQEHVPRALEAGCTVVDASSAFRADPDVPLIVPAVNGNTLGRLGERRLVACPSGAAVALVTVLSPIHAAVGVERVNVVSLQAVSGAGREAVEDLASQCAQLLNGRSPGPSPHFGAQIAFNVIPQIGTPDADGATAEEDALAFETQKILGDPAIKVMRPRCACRYFSGTAWRCISRRASRCRSAGRASCWRRRRAWSSPRRRPRRTRWMPPVWWRWGGFARTARTPGVSISGSPPITSGEDQPPILWTSSKFWCASISRLYFVK
jgi:aspartate-semialdehyde dehydrogenase